MNLTPLKLKNNPAYGKDIGKQKIAYVSPSALESWLMCGLKYRLSAIEHHTLKKRAAVLAFGTVFHSTAESIWKGKKPDFAAEWRKIKDDKTIDYGKSSWAQFFDTGVRMTDALGMKIKSKIIPKTSKIEVMDTVDLGFVLVRRRRDLVIDVHELPTVQATGEPALLSARVNLDLKSARSKYDPLKLLKSLQLKIYALPTKWERGKDVTFDRLTSVYAVVTKSAKPDVQFLSRRYTDEEMKRLLAYVKDVVGIMRSGQFIRREGDHCNWCDFKAMCYEQKGWQTAYALREAHVHKPEKEVEVDE